MVMLLSEQTMGRSYHPRGLRLNASKPAARLERDFARIAVTIRRDTCLPDGRCDSARNHL